QVFHIRGFFFVRGVANPDGLIAPIIPALLHKLDDPFEKFLLSANFFQRHKLAVLHLKQRFNIQQAADKSGRFGYPAAPREIC
ncbi:hypothetical protein L6R34_30760, partial [Escherichia coli]|nr:hypothetical protein [Escherichia coli]